MDRLPDRPRPSPTALNGPPAAAARPPQAPGPAWGPATPPALLVHPGAASDRGPATPGPVWGNLGLAWRPIALPGHVLAGIPHALCRTLGVLTVEALNLFHSRRLKRTRQLPLFSLDLRRSQSNKAKIKLTCKDLQDLRLGF